MRTIKLLLSLIISGVIVTGCSFGSPVIVDMITKNTSFEDFNKDYSALGFSSVIHTNSADYTVFFIAVLTTSDRQDHSYVDGNKTKTKTTIISHSDGYFFVFHNNYYIYSGFLYEFLNSNDPAIKEIGATLRSTFGTEGITTKVS